MILFEKIRWKNILSTGNHFTEVNLTDTSTTLIIGANGSGKSTVLDALTFSLFGKPFRKINKLQLLNSTNEKDGRVEVEFSINEPMESTRGIKPIYLRFIEMVTFLISSLLQMINKMVRTKCYQDEL